MQQPEQAQVRVAGRQCIRGAQRVVERIPGARLRLRYTPHGLQLGQHDHQQSQALHHRERPRRWCLHLIGSQDAKELVAHPLARKRARRGGVATKRIFGRRIELEAKPRRKAHGPQDPQRVLGKALVGVAHRAQHTALEVSRSVVGIDQQAAA